MARRTTHCFMFLISMIKIILIQQQSSQHMQQSAINRPYTKKMFEMVNAAGKLHIEVNAFKRYFFVIVTYAGLLKLDGGIQLTHPTHYSAHPTVINITPEYPPEGEDIARKLGEELKCPVVLWVGIELGNNKKGEEQLLIGLLQVLRSMQ